MRNPRFKSIVPNYRKSVLEITLAEGKKSSRYRLPFSVFRDLKIDSKNRFVSIVIDHEIGDQGASFVLRDGSKGDFPADLVLYYCDPKYEWSPLNQLKRAIQDKLKQSKISVRVLADLLQTSPSQVVRLLRQESFSKQLLQLFRMAEIAGYQVQFHLKKSLAA